MQPPDSFMEIFLNPGEYYFGDHETRIRTVLGSCVSMTLWHPRLRVGGMTHFMLPTRSSEGTPAESDLDGRYADEALELLMAEIDAVGAPHREYQVKLFGGGNMFPTITKQGQPTLGDKNIDTARDLIGRYGFPCAAEHLGGKGHRNVIFDVWSGDVWVKHPKLQSY